MGQQSESTTQTSGEQQESRSTGTMALGLLKTLRPHQWIKNLFVLAPLFFSLKFDQPGVLGYGLAAAFLFCLAAGSVYLINDIFDVEKDRQHPVKRHRPIPSGQLPVPVARVSAVVIALGTVGACLAIDRWLAAAVGGYLVMNLAYSSALKHIAFLDVSIIATGFVLRVLAGKFATGVYVSEWLIGCTFLLALYLGLGKRAHELQMDDGEDGSKSRTVLEQYRKKHLNFAALYVAGLAIAGYTIWTLTAALPELTAVLSPLAAGPEAQPLRSRPTPFANPWLPVTVLFAIFGIVRFYQLITNDNPHSPTDQILRDWPFILNLVLWAVAMLVVAYL